MALPIFAPISTSPTAILSSSGNPDLVASNLVFNIYGNVTSPYYSTDFLTGAADEVGYVYKKLGGDVLDIELKNENVYCCYEEAVLEYSMIVNMHQAKNSLSKMLGSPTGTFDHDGVLKSGSLSSSLGGTHISLKFPKFDFIYARQVGNTVSSEVRVGGNKTIYSASVDIISGVQDYDLQLAVSSSAVLTASLDYYNKIGNKKIVINKVFFKSPAAGWRFYQFYGALNTVGNLSTYGQYADDSTFQIVPIWQNKLQAKEYEDALWVRASHFSYELRNNKLRIFPIPQLFGSSAAYPQKIWFEFYIPSDVWVEEDSTINTGIDGINNLNTIPFDPIPFKNINMIGKQWIRNYALACAKETLGQIRGKFSTIPIPGDNVTLNWAELLTQAKEEKDALRQELKDILDQLTYTKLAEDDALLLQYTNDIQKKIPLKIFVG